VRRQIVRNLRPVRRNDRAQNAIITRRGFQHSARAGLDVEQDQRERQGRADLNNTEFYIEYEQPVSVSVGDTPSTRTLTAGSNAIAELYRATRVKNRYVFTSLGRYYMPMQMTISTK